MWALEKPQSTLKVHIHWFNVKLSVVLIRHKDVEQKLPAVAQHSLRSSVSRELWKWWGYKSILNKLLWRHKAEVRLKHHVWYENTWYNYNAPIWLQGIVSCLIVSICHRMKYSEIPPLNPQMKHLNSAGFNLVEVLTICIWTSWISALYLGHCLLSVWAECVFVCVWCVGTCLQWAWSAAESFSTGGALARSLLEDMTGAAVEKRTSRILTTHTHSSSEVHNMHLWKASSGRWRQM